MLFTVVGMFEDSRKEGDFEPNTKAKNGKRPTMTNVELMISVTEKSTFLMLN